MENKGYILGMSRDASVDCLEDKELNHINLFKSQEFLSL